MFANSINKNDQTLCQIECEAFKIMIWIFEWAENITLKFGLYAECSQLYLDHQLHNHNVQPQNVAKQYSNVQGNSTLLKL